MVLILLISLTIIFFLKRRKRQIKNSSEHQETNEANNIIKIESDTTKNIEKTNFATLEIESMQSTSFSIKDNKYIMRSTIDSILDSLITTTQSGIIVDCNLHTEEIFGFKREELINKSISKLMPEDVAINYDKQMKNFINTNTDINAHIKREIVCKRKNNKKFHANISISMFKSDHETYFVALIRNIDDKKIYERKTKEAIAKSQEASRSKQMFLASMSHELRTPLNTVIGMSEVLRDTNLNTEQEKYIGSILKSGKNLLQIINNVLDISKIEANELKIEEIEVDVEKMISDIVDILDINAYKKSIDLNYYVSNVNHYLITDPTRLKQVLINLVNNAIKFTNKGSVTILASTNDKSDHIKFEIIDTGIGINKENIKKIFNPFTQEKDSTSRQYGGTGLGLNISMSLTQLMGGKIEVNSEVGIGSNFFFSLPHNKLKKLKKPTPNLTHNFLFICDDLSTRTLIKNYINDYKIKAAVKDIQQFKSLMSKGKFDNKLKIIILTSTKNDLNFKIFNTLTKKGVRKENIAVGVRINDINNAKVKVIKHEVIYLIDLPIKRNEFLTQLTDLQDNKKQNKHNEIKKDVNSKKNAIIIDDSSDICNYINAKMKHPEVNIQAFSDSSEASKYLKKNFYDIIVCDYTMPNLNGSDIFKIAKESKSKDSPFILISGVIEGIPIDLLKKVIYLEKPLNINLFKQIYFDSLKLSPLKIKKNKSIQTQSLKKPIILVVDDSEENRELMEAYLKDEDIILFIAKNGQEAINIAEKQSCDIIFMDMQMPILDGVSATKKIRELPNHQKAYIYALSANITQEEKESAINAGCSEYITKPVSKKKIKNIILELREKNENYQNRS